jgi:hypothetical protein
VQSLQQMILGPYLAGMRATYAPGADRLKVRDKPIAVYPGRWPPVLDAAHQDAIAAILAGRRTPARSGTNVKHMLSGMVTCGRCGGPAWASTASATQGSLHKYTCPKGHVGRDMTAVNRVAEHAIFHWWEPNGAMDAAQEAEARDRDGGEGANLLAENRADRALLDGLEDKLADGLLDKAGFLRQQRRITDRIQARDKVIAKRQRQSELDGIPERGEKLQARWHAEGLEFQWRVLAASVAKVVIHPTGKGGHPFDPRAIQVIHGGALACLDPADPVLTVPAPAAVMRRGREPSRKIRAWLAANPGDEFTPTSLAAELAMSLASVRQIVTRMRKDGEITPTTPLRRGGRSDREARSKAIGWKGIA